MKTLYESILSTTNSGKYADILGFDMKKFKFSNEITVKNINEEICEFYNISFDEAESVLDCYDALKKAKKSWKNVQVVLDKSMPERLRKAYSEGKITFSWNPKCVPTIYKTQIPLVIKVRDKFYIWHWGTQRDLFTHQYEWLEIIKK